MKGNSYAPDETIIKLSRTKLLTENILWSTLMIVCLYSAYFNLYGLRYLALLLFFLFLYGVYQNVKKAKKEPKIQLRLSNKGLTLKNESFINWSEIKKMEVIVKPNYSSSIQQEYLVVNTNKDKTEFYINELNISSLRLEYLIKIYRKRFDKKQNN
ncbi:hypothetical protein D1816_02235 [Aquimarina sp. AD10]|uniref:hypothetical protein n=1 Tax=Aquimarina sp. AD10 TaxID=1714849 RepID=UPI000E52BD16|nr:hypothetical protein [Aquimarina sp. AD10]AXT59213.1 hypothetical protein D1816_02235 [Aquimarina sp. AD10]RKM92703.1 hypothetical protein D7033_20810 [Aquimarina sp. AD10]